MNNLEKIGLLKMDIFGVAKLNGDSDTCDLIQQDVPDFRIDEIPLDDKATYDLFSTGESIGIFQCESPACGA